MTDIMEEARTRRKLMTAVHVGWRVTRKHAHPSQPPMRVPRHLSKLILAILPSTGLLTVMIVMAPHCRSSSNCSALVHL